MAFRTNPHCHYNLIAFLQQVRIVYKSTQQGAKRKQYIVCTETKQPPGGSIAGGILFCLKGNSKLAAGRDYFTAAVFVSYKYH